MTLKTKPARLLVALSFVMPALSTPALAQDGVAMLRQLDTNGDGLISAAEAEAGAKQQFKQMDRNHDGVLSEQEFVNARLALFRALDTDGDSNVSRSEINTRVMAGLFRK